MQFAATLGLLLLCLSVLGQPAQVQAPTAVNVSNASSVPCALLVRLSGGCDHPLGGGDVLRDFCPEICAGAPRQLGEDEPSGEPEEGGEGGEEPACEPEEEPDWDGTPTEENTVWVGARPFPVKLFNPW